MDETRGLGAYDDMGDVNLFGLDEFGMPVGLSPMWGGVIGAVVSNGTAAAYRLATDDPKYLKYDEIAGLGAGVLASGVMFIFRGTRAAAWASLLTTLGSTGIRALEKALMSKEKRNALAQSMQLDGIEISRIPTLQGQLGLTTVEQVPTLSGLPMQLVGAAQQGNQSAGGSQVPVLLNGLANQFGYTYANAG